MKSKSTLLGFIVSYLAVVESRSSLRSNSSSIVVIEGAFFDSRNNNIRYVDESSSHAEEKHVFSYGAGVLSGLMIASIWKQVKKQGENKSHANYINEFEESDEQNEPLENEELTIIIDHHGENDSHGKQRNGSFEHLEKEDLTIRIEHESRNESVEYLEKLAIMNDEYNRYRPVLLKLNPPCTQAMGQFIEKRRKSKLAKYARYAKNGYPMSEEVMMNWRLVADEMSYYINEYNESSVKKGGLIVSEQEVLDQYGIIDFILKSVYEVKEHKRMSVCRAAIANAHLSIWYAINGGFPIPQKLLMKYQLMIDNGLVDFFILKSLQTYIRLNSFYVATFYDLNL
jgi:hypothetical protein